MNYSYTTIQKNVHFTRFNEKTTSSRQSVEDTVEQQLKATEATAKIKYGKIVKTEQVGDRWCCSIRNSRNIT
jgi:hypothetical protein